jgi:ribosomal protein S18 acetylase RimI-like enzyme
VAAHHADDLNLRPITGRGELDLFTRLSYVLDDELDGDLAAGRRHPEWMWVALRGDRLVARAAWWARPKTATPYVLDVFDLDPGVPDRVEAGVRLLRTAMAAVVPRDVTRPEYSRLLPPGWRDDPRLRGPVEERVSALERAGARVLVERIRFEWRPGRGTPAPTGRLAFRAPYDAEELIGLMAEVLDGTLDAHGRADLTRMTAREAAVAQYEGEFAGYDSPRGWWRVATLPGGEPVGFVVPARNAYHPIIAYLGVRPAHRGRGHVDEILAEGTRVLAAEGVSRVRASTDVGNTPMAAAFRRAGYAAFEHRIDMTWR